MKTSIIISTIAAVCLMITLAESTINRDSQNKKETLYSNILYMPANNFIAKTEVKWSSITKTNVSAKTKVNGNNDFSYLKFDVADYSEADEVAVEVNDLKSLDYLKFNLNDYTATDNDETFESPANEFDYLKFTVNNCPATNNADSPESVESPINEFDYLKFDVCKYSSDDLGSDQDVELQITE